MYGYNPYQQQYYPNYQQNVVPQQNVASQSNTMAIATEEEVLKYPVAPGNSIAFKIDGQPLIIEKSMGTSQFDSPKYERYRLIKEGETPKAEDKTEYIPKSVYEDDRHHTDDSIEQIKASIDELTTQLYDEIDSIKKIISRNRVKKENTND